ncbi:substrate-binding periplasmic protein [Thalassospira sp. UBA1131]|uniref:substrate-binding periplasmic protein n=1 Tax=Thalassospira sp. UBA1131 TaxID=1947672 RepID=UPI0025EBB204|nr:transporter substrate-binding domain-containing protein [Thalassospira sp. UBA1131]
MTPFLQKAKNQLISNWIGKNAAIFAALTITFISTLIGAALADNSFGSSASERKTVTLACNPFPAAMIADNNVMPGFDVEILRAAFATRDITLLTPFYPWKRAYLLASAGHVDGLCSCSYLPERDAEFLYSDPLGDGEIAMYSTNEQVFDMIDTEDASKLTVGVVNGYSLEVYARKAKFDVMIANSEKALVNLLNSNRIDAALTFRPPMDYYLLNGDEDGLPDVERIRTKVISTSSHYSCISRKTEAPEIILDHLNAGLKTIRQSGLFDSILAKYRTGQNTSDAAPEQN